MAFVTCMALHGIEVRSDTCRVCGNSCPTESQLRKGANSERLTDREKDVILRVVTANESRNDRTKDKAKHWKTETRLQSDVGSYSHSLALVIPFSETQTLNVFK